jgi:hypothetical protein
MTPGSASRKSAIQRSASSAPNKGAVAEGRARAGVEEVDRHLGRIDLPELAQQLQPLFDRLAHAEEGAAAQLHARRPHQPARLEPLVPAVGGGDVREERPGRLEVVVVAVHPSSRIRAIVRSSGPRTARTMQNSEAPSRAVSSAASRTSSVSRKGVAFTGVS